MYPLKLGEAFPEDRPGNDRSIAGGLRNFADTDLLGVFRGGGVDVRPGRDRVKDVLSVRAAFDEHPVERRLPPHCPQHGNRYSRGNLASKPRHRRAAECR